MAGNVWEWTLEWTSNSSNPCAGRGGGFYGFEGSFAPASYRNVGPTTGGGYTLGFRLSLY